jgi:opacity protein-like surface antigen
MLTRTLLAALIAAVGAPAIAAGLDTTVVTAAPPAPVAVASAPIAASASSDWTGFYIGGSLSYGDISVEDFDADGNGRLNGLHAGYMFDFGRIVVGAELESEWSAVSIDDLDLDIDRVARAKLRVGYDAGRILPYITAGYAQVSLSGALEDDFDGRFAGIGAEYRISERFSTGLEVLRHEFDDVGADGTTLDATTISLRGTFRF